jgi:hypothetical protein
VILTEQVTPETLTMAQIAMVERHARETHNKKLLLACQRAADTRRHNHASMCRVATWINAHTAFINGMRDKMPR